MENNQMTLNPDELEMQVVNLVKAAMSGDEEANETISQIIDAAEKGDEEAIKIVSIIKQLTQSAQSQPEESTEAMKCGGKVRAKMKAKKCETGGEVLEEKCGGAAKKNSAASKVRKSCKAKKCENGNTLTDTLKFLLGAKCGGKMKKPKKCESGDHIEELEDYLAVKCGGKMKKTKKHEEGGLISLDFSQIDFAKCGKKLKKKEDGGEITEEKCGGKAKKVKKGEVGVQLPEGAHGQIRSKSISAVFAKGGNTCPCALKRVGGKIVTVDSCTGLPIHKNGGNVNYLQAGGTSTYSVGPNGDLESATPKEKMDRMRRYGAPSTRNISYNYVPGLIHAVSGIDTYSVIPHTNTGSYIKNANGIYLPVTFIENGKYTPARPEYNTDPDLDVFRFPDGTVSRKRPPQVPNIPQFPVTVPTLTPNNTSTLGSALQGNHGNIRGGVYPVGAGTQILPEDYVPEEWQEIHDQVNGLVRKTWRNPKTGEVVTVKPEGIIIPAKAIGGSIKKFQSPDSPIKKK